MKKTMNVSSLYGLEMKAMNESSNEWNSLNNDPQMYFNETFVKGFYKIVWQGASNDTRYLRLYINYGEGYSQENSLLLGVLNEKENTHFKIVKFDNDVKDIRLDPGDMPGDFKFENLSFEKISFVSYFRLALEKYANMYGNESIFRLMKKGYRKWREHGFKWVITRAETLLINHSSDSGMQQNYESYKFVEQEPMKYIESASDPLFSIVLPFHSGDLQLLKTCLDSVKRQSFTKYEIIIVGKNIVGLTNYFEKSQLKLIEVASDNFMDHINAALPHISGDYTFVLEEEDFISINTLYYASQAIKETNSDLIYMDEDRFMGEEHFAPLFKGEFILSDIKNKSEFIGPVFVKSEIMKENSGIDHYSLLKDNLITQSKVIQHIPQVIYHKRASVSQWEEGEKEKLKSFPSIFHNIMKFLRIMSGGEKDLQNGQMLQRLFLYMKVIISLKFQLI
ncbi:hypothetical protein [Paenibacillus ihuae]|uniref:hypothetical protein n=1 Tax=Paenibacillus ihuae TaxID=1232431 RepID=UPI0006D5740D|nr:hypothetical protein [Paenibacillus ihuae]